MIKGAGTELARVLTDAVDVLSSGKLNSNDAAALRDRYGAPDIRARMSLEELACCLVEIRRPGLIACAVAELLYEREQEQQAKA